MDASDDGYNILTLIFKKFSLMDGLNDGYCV